MLRDRSIAGFCAHDPTLFHPNLWVAVFPFDQIAHVGVSRSQNRYLKPFSRENFLSIPTCVKIIPERHRRTDGQTYIQTDDIL